MSGQLDLVGLGSLERVHEGVTATAAERIVAATSENTMRAYARWWDGTTKTRGTPKPEQGQGFVGWCYVNGRLPLPADEATFGAWINHLCDQGYAPASISQAMAAVRTMHTRAGHDAQPPTRIADLAVKGYRRLRAEAGITGQKMAPPISPTSLRLMLEVCDPTALVGTRDRALLTLGYGLMGRRSELVALHRHHVVRDGDDGLVVTIAQSKTDQDAEGDEVAVPRGVFEQTDPVAAVESWQEALDSRGAQGRLFRSIDRHGRLGDHLSASVVNDIIKARAQQADLPNARAYSAHSLRAGALTAALRAGVPLGVAARHGRWSPTSPVVNQYARTEARWRDNAMKGVL